MYLYGCNTYFGPGMADFSYKLSGDYSLAKAGNGRIWSNNKQIVTDDVTEISWDEDFILAKQEVLTKQQNKNINYWIINVKENKTYGPLNEEEFNNKRKELNVNDELKLEKREKYKYLDESIKNMK